MRQWARAVVKTTVKFNITRIKGQLWVKGNLKEMPLTNNYFYNTAFIFNIFKR
jgi:hypothetical protein